MSLGLVHNALLCMHITYICINAHTIILPEISAELLDHMKGQLNEHFKNKNLQSQKFISTMIYLFLQVTVTQMI